MDVSVNHHSAWYMADPPEKLRSIFNPSCCQDPRCDIIHILYPGPKQVGICIGKTTAVFLIFRKAGILTCIEYVSWSEPAEG